MTWIRRWAHCGTLYTYIHEPHFFYASSSIIRHIIAYDTIIRHMIGVWDYTINLKYLAFVQNMSAIHYTPVLSNTFFSSCKNGKLGILL